MGKGESTWDNYRERDSQLEKDYKEVREVVNNMTEEEREELEWVEQQNE